MMKYWFIYSNTDLLLEKHDDCTYSVPLSDDCPVSVHPWTTIHRITPMDDGTEVRTFVLDSPLDMGDGYEYIGLRKSYYFLPLDIYMKAGKCQEINYWHQNTHFCGVCGAPMKLNTDISKVCTQCGKEIWPQLSTAIIVLIHKDDDSVLLARGRNFHRDFYGLIAGFVETGETLEEAVRREVHEEVGLEIDGIKYFDSQPWPYPCGLMVGFNAHYVSGDIKLQKEEIAKAAWFKRDNLPNLPEKLSIARRLIDTWIGI